MRSLTRAARLAGAGLSLVAIAGLARADNVAFNLTAVGTYPPLTANGFNYTQGDYQLPISFKAAAPIAVTELGYYDSTLGGVAEPNGTFTPHTVTLLDTTTGATLATATVTGAAGAVGLFRYAPIGSVALNRTDTYQIVGNTGANYYAVGVNVSAAPINRALIVPLTVENIFGGNSPPGTLPDFGPSFEFVTATTTATAAQVQASIAALGVTRESQMITSRVLSSLLLGANEQVNCSSCGSGFASVGSFAAGTHGRWSLTDRLTLMAGASFDEFRENGANVTSAPMIAASLVYDLVDWGRSRPFFEVGGSVDPYESVTYTRNYGNGAGSASGQGSTGDRAAEVFGRVGWVARLSPIEEAAVYGDLSRSWQQTGGYTEMTNGANPFVATVGSGTDSLDVARIGAQYTRLLLPNVEGNINGGVARGFAGEAGINANVAGFGAIANPAMRPVTWAEFGARLGYRLTEKLVVDAFVLGTAGAEPAGNTIHGGLGLRYSF